MSENGDYKGRVANVACMIYLPGHGPMRRSKDRLPYQTTTDVDTRARFSTAPVWSTEDRCLINCATNRARYASAMLWPVKSRTRRIDRLSDLKWKGLMPVDT